MRSGTCSHRSSFRGVTESAFQYWSPVSSFNRNTGRLGTIQRQWSLSNFLRFFDQVMQIFQKDEILLWKKNAMWSYKLPLTMLPSKKISQNMKKYGFCVKNFQLSWSYWLRKVRAENSVFGCCSHPLQCSKDQIQSFPPYPNQSIFDLRNSNKPSGKTDFWVPIWVSHLLSDKYTNCIPNPHPTLVHQHKGTEYPR